MELDTLDTIFALIKEVDAVLLGLRQLRGHVGEGVGAQMVEVLIEDVEKRLAELKRKVIQ
jgi:hypothetical protein